MKFQELDSITQEKALNKLRDINTEFEWYEDSYLYFTEVCSRFGLSIYRIYFSGFDSQGDGASFTGDFEWKEPNEAIPDAIASAVQTLKEQSALIRAYDPECKLLVRISQRGRYCHEYTMRFEWEIYNYENETDKEAMERLLDEESIAEAFRDIARWLYICLEKEHEYLTSDEAIKETIEANDYEFDEDGDLA